MASPNLRSVPTDPAEPPVDIYAAIRAKREAIDWSRVHINGDRAKEIALPVGWRARR